MSRTALRAFVPWVISLVGILIGSEQFAPRAGRAALIGEVSLGGEIRTVPGLLPMVVALARRRVGRVIVPDSSAHGVKKRKAGTVR